MSIKQTIFDYDDSQRTPVEVWGQTLFVESCSYARLKELEKYAKDHPDADPGLAMVVATCVDDTGNHVFDWDDVEALSKKRRSGLKMIVDAAEKLNILDNETIEDIAGKSEVTATSDCNAD